MTETTHLLHGLWLRGSGLHLWLEQAEGHVVVDQVVDPPLPEESLPPGIRRLLAERPARHRIPATLRTPKGRPVELTVPTWAWFPDRAAEVLTELATAGSTTAFAPDLQFLIRLSEGIDRFARAGRVLIRMVHEDGQWFPRWMLATGMAEQAWLTAMAAAAPGVVTLNCGDDVVDVVVDQLTHPLVTRRLLTLPSATNGRHSFVQHLLDSAPVRRLHPDVIDQLSQWRASVRAEPVDLVLALDEPPEEGSAQGPALWPLRVLARTPSVGPQPVGLEALADGSYRLFNQQLVRAAQALPMLARAASGPRGLDLWLSEEEVAQLIGDGARRLAELGVTLLLPRSWAAREPRLTVEVQPEREIAGAVAGGTVGRVGFAQLVSYKWRIAVGDQVLSDADMAELVDSRTGLIRLKDRWVYGDPAVLARVRRYLAEQTTLGKALGEGVRTLAELRAEALEIEQPRPLAVDYEGAAWVTGLLAGDPMPSPAPVSPPAGLTARLRPYQQRGLDWLVAMSDLGFGAILADDMGLGKTIQVLALLLHEKERAALDPQGPVAGPTLVVAPTSLLDTWHGEAARHAPDLAVQLHHGPKRTADEEFTAAAAAADVVVTSYGVLVRDWALLGQVAWNRVCLDEAQAIKNPNTRASRAARSLPARTRLALTGTPVENNLSELHTILDFCNPGMLGSASWFRNRYAAAVERDNDEGAAASLRAVTGPFILRRVKSDPRIIADLPEKTEQVRSVHLTREQAALYQGYVDQLDNWVEEAEGIGRKGRILAALTRLRQICNHPAHFLGDGSGLLDPSGRHRSGKVAELERIVDAAVESGGRTLVFTQYTAFGHLLMPWLRERYGRDIGFLHGQVDRRQRARLVEQFQAPDGPAVLLLSLRAGGTGLTLTAANHVVHLDRWWNPAVENQATDRAYRIGQDRDVEVIKLVAAGTMEEAVDDIITGKSLLASSVIGPGEGWITDLGLADLRRLWQLRADFHAAVATTDQESRQ